MTGPPAQTAAVRVAVRRALADLAPDVPVAAAVSGGADSLALAAALAHESPGSAALVVDHGLQAGSAQVAARAAEQCAGLGLVARVLVAEDPHPCGGHHLPRPPGTGGRAAGRGAGAGPSGSGGPEARARTARYAALERALDQTAVVLLGHTRDDQAETVLLGLARGAGARSLAGMAPVRGRYRRPLLDLPRAVVRAACEQAGLTPWEDPHNADPAYARVRVRADVLPALEQAVGPGVAAALARSARQLREDADALDALTPQTDEVAVLAALPAALRARALAGLAERGCGRAVTAAHVEALRALVEQWSGQGPVALPGGLRVRREAGRLLVEPPG